MSKLTSKLLTVGFVAVALAATHVSAHAADAARPPAYRPPLAVIYDWTGFYIGGHVGLGWTGGDNGESGFLGGGQVGFNYQVGQWVLGAEGQMSATGIKDSVSATLFMNGVPVGTARAEASLDWISTLAVRAGFAFDRWLVYGKVGGAWAHVSATAFANVGNLSASASADDTFSGWMLGVGTEYALRDNWSVKLEYNMMDFGNDFGDKVHVLKGGVNYRFNFDPRRY
jgi:outer membrane immunogenic protein